MKTALLEIGAESVPARFLRSALAQLEPGARPEQPPISESALANYVGRSPCIVIHAGDLDPTVGPSGARHITATEFKDIVRDARSLSTSLSSLETSQQKLAR